MSRRRQRRVPKPCPTPTKRPLPTKAEAKCHAESLAKMTHQEVRVYRCQCGTWHLTTWSLEDWEQLQTAREGMPDE